MTIITCVGYWWTSESTNYRQISNISRTKSQNLNDSSLVLQLPLPNPLKPCVKSRMKMQLEQRRLEMLQLPLGDQSFYCLLKCSLYERFYGTLRTGQSCMYLNIRTRKNLFRLSWSVCWFAIVIQPQANAENVSIRRHRMETFSALLALCAENSPVTKTNDTKLCCFLWSALSKRLSKQSRLRWFETPLRSLWRQ